jgi:hypothetical protein
MTNIDNIKRKIQGILAKTQEGAGSTEAEAQGALEFARRLMMRHKLTEADLGADRKRTAHEIAADTEYGQVDAYMSSSKLSTWEWILACAINDLIGTTKAYRSSVATKRTLAGTLEFDAQGQPKRAARLISYGPVADCRDAREMFDEWSLTIAALARMKFGGAMRGEGRAYCEGFTLALQESVKVMVRNEGQFLGSSTYKTIGMADAALVAANETENGSACSALVISGARELMLAQSQQASKWLEKEAGVKLRKAGGLGGGQRHNDAHGAGRADGKNANFSRNQTKRIQ